MFQYTVELPYGLYSTSYWLWIRAISFFSFFSIPSGPEVLRVLPMCCLFSHGPWKIATHVRFSLFRKKKHKNQSINLHVFVYGRVSLSVMYMWCLAVTSFLGSKPKGDIWKAFLDSFFFFSTTAYGFGQMQIMVIVWLLYYIIFWSFLGSTISSPSWVSNLIISLSLSTVKLKAQNYYQLWVVTCEYEIKRYRRISGGRKKKNVSSIIPGGITLCVAQKSKDVDA